MKTWVFIRDGVVIGIEGCVDKPPNTMVDGLPAIVREKPEGDWEPGDPLPPEFGTVMIGEGIPNNKFGSNNSIYVNIDNGNVYRKQNSTWF